jgi:BirA family transcriptional regulator, biotin operon repressor / biotin---[acetyl-CoA-carboxylase] ligase
VLEKSSAVVPKLIYFDEIDSTNAELARMEKSSLPEFTALVSASQSAGRGRMDRDWVSEPGASLAVSVLLRPKAQPAELSWITLIAALSVRAAIGALGVQGASIKWPNDVLVDGKKISGILARLEGEDLILGVGINLKSQANAPEHATSLAELGIQSSFDEVLAEFLTQLRGRYLRFAADSSWAVGLTGDEFREFSSTLGQRVRAIYPDGRELTGIAKDIDGLGNLVIDDGELHTVSAADIVHLRN